MSSITPVNPESAGRSFKAYHPHAMRVAAGTELLYISGCTARNHDNELVGAGDIGVQARQVFSNIEGILADVGSTLSDVIKVTVYLTDLDLFPVVADIRAELFGDSGPASACVEVSGLVRPGALIEVEAIAAIPGNS